MRDRLVRFLNQFGYQPVFLAQTNVEPPEVYNYTADRRLIRRGPLQHYLKGRTAKGLIDDIGKHISEGAAPDLEHIETRSKRLDAAASFLKAALAAIGVAGRFEVDLRIARNTELKFAFNNVVFKRLDPSRLDWIIQDVCFATGIPPEYVEAGRLHVVYEYLYADTLVMRKGDNSSFGSGADVGVKDIVKGDARVKVELENETTIRFSSDTEKVAFAYKAGRVEEASHGRYYFYPEEIEFLPPRTALLDRALTAGASPSRYVYAREMEPLLAIASSAHPVARKLFIPQEGMTLTVHHQ